MKLFTTKSIETVKYCQEYFDFSLPSVLWAKRVARFEVSFERFFLRRKTQTLIGGTVEYDYTSWLSYVTEQSPDS